MDHRFTAFALVKDSGIVTSPEPTETLMIFEERVDAIHHVLECEGEEIKEVDIIVKGI